MKISLILEAVDRWSGPVKKFGNATRDAANRGLGTFADRARKAGESLRRFSTDTERGERIGRRWGDRIREMAVKDLSLLRGGLALTAKGVENLGLSMARWGLHAAVGGIAGLAAGGVAATGLFARSVISTGSQFEQYKVQLQTMLGSAQAADKAFGFIQKFAQQTPYEIDEVTRAFITAKQQGIDPFGQSMVTVGDTASGMGRSFVDTLLALGDASRFQFERLIDFGITASQKGGKVTLSYIDMAGKEIKTSVAKSQTAVRDAVLKIWGARFAGGMDRMSKTLEGTWNNLKDIVTLFQYRVGEKGFFAVVKNDLSAVYEWSQKIENQSKLDQWAQIASDKMTELWQSAKRFVTETDWQSVATGIGAIVGALIQATSWIGKAAKAWERFSLVQEQGRLNLVVESNGLFGTGVGAPSAAAKTKAINRLLEISERIGEIDYGGAPAKPAPIAKTPPRGTLPDGQRALWTQLTAPRKDKVAVDIILRGPGATGAQLGGLTTTPGAAASVKRGPAMGPF